MTLIPTPIQGAESDLLFAHERQDFEHVKLAALTYGLTVLEHAVGRLLDGGLGKATLLQIADDLKKVAREMATRQEF